MSPEFKNIAVNMSSTRAHYIPLHDGKDLPRRMEGNHLFKYSKVSWYKEFPEIMQDNTVCKLHLCVLTGIELLRNSVFAL